MRAESVIFAMLILAGCGQRQAADSSDNHETIPSNAAAVPKPQAVLPRIHPEASLAEPKGAIDPKSVEAAGQVVQQFGALIEQAQYGEAAKLWGDPAAGAAFTRALRPHTHLEIGDLGAAEGAAGSIYTTVPVVFYGEGFRRSAQIVLRRVNDVPGSTAAQRRWHIERIDWSAAA